LFNFQEKGGRKIFLLRVQGEGKVLKDRPMLAAHGTIEKKEDGTLGERGEVLVAGLK